MAITFHCDHCGKKIEAGDSAAGKWGKCPSCGNKIYIPDLTTGEELQLSPIDEEAEKRKKELMVETFKLEQDILSQRESSEEGGQSGSAITEINQKELTKNIILYLRYTADGNLGDAEKIVAMITRGGQESIKILDKIAVSQMPEPELSDVPVKVLVGFIRALRGKINAAF